MERTLYIILFFMIGTIFGSFYNVVGYRLSLNKSIIKPRNSYCPKCKTNLKTVDLIPIFSYLFLKGKCRYCKAEISIFYPIIEFITGILFAVSFYSFSFSFDLLISLSLVSLFSIIIVSDLNFYIIPDEVTLFFGILIVIINILKHGFLISLTYIINGLVMFLFMYVVGEIGKWLFKKEALGGGDIKLLFVLGLTMPLVSCFFGIILATIFAIPISTYLVLKNKDRIIPFGPFLVAGFLVLFLAKIDVTTIYKFFEII